MANDGVAPSPDQATRRKPQDGRGQRVQVVEVDERDSGWEIDEPRFRVYAFEGVDNATSCYEITGVEVLEVILWAQARCSDNERYAVALVHDERQHDGSVDRGLVWLLGN